MKKHKQKQEEKPKLPAHHTLEADAASPEFGIFKLARPLGRTFASFRHPNYSYLWTGSFLSNIGTWLQITALTWVVFSITKSTLAVGVVNFLNMFPVFVLVLYAGALADRVNRRNLLIIIQVALLIFALALGILATLNKLTMPWIFTLTLATGAGTAFMFPTYQALIPEVVPRRDLMNAIALNSAQFNGARLVGPVVAGIILATYGAATNFYLNSVSFLAVIFALMLIKPTVELNPKSTEGGWQHLTEGLRYARKHSYVGLLLIYVGILAIFGISFVVLLPAYASKILKVGAHGYGLLLGASGLGTFAGALTVATFSHIKNKANLLRWTIASFGLFIIFFSFSRVFLLSLLLLAIVGWSFMTSTSAINTMVQEAVPNEIRGRIMGIYVWMFLGLQPFGSLAFGALAHLTTTQIPLILGGSVLLAASLLVFLNPRLLRAS